MTSTKHTPGPYSQGYLIDTRVTLAWSNDLRAKVEAEEKCRVVSNFHQSDMGKSRTVMAVCFNPEDAARIAACLQALDGIDDPAKLRAEYATMRKALGTIIAMTCSVGGIAGQISRIASAALPEAP